MQLAESTAKERVGQLLEYLIEYSRLKSPPILEVTEYAWHLQLAATPDHPCIELFPEAPEGEEERVLLRVTRPELAECPPPSDELKKWLKPGWRRYDLKEPQLLHPREVDETTVDQLEPNEKNLEDFEYPPEVSEEFGQWVLKRMEWRTRENPTWKALQLFDRLFTLKGTLEREGERYAVALGDGVLQWQTEDERPVQHPLLIQRCSLTFDSTIPQFQIAYAEDELQFPTSLLREMKDADLSAVSHLVQELRRQTFDILSADAKDFLRSLARRLWSRGDFFEEEQRPPTDRPAVVSNPVLFLEPRGRGYVEAASHLRNKLDDFKIPSALQRLVGVDPDDERQTGSSDTSVPLLFTKPSNLEQERVARRLAANGSVLVQGPPGTGKTHTIANLIGHLLAQGKSILVTSHTAKALSVVRDQVAPQLRDLCVSVLDDGREGREMLKSAVQSIADRMNQASAEELGRKADRLGKQRDELQHKIGLTEKQLIQGLRTEYTELIVGGQTIRPSDAARKLAEWKGRHDWIPGQVSACASCPLTIQEVEELYQLQRTLPQSDENLIGLGLPPVGKLPNPQKFEELVAGESELKDMGISYGEELWSIERPDAAQLTELKEEALACIAPLQSREMWIKACLEAGREETERVPWEELLDQINSAAQDISKRQALVLRHGPTIGQTELNLQQQLRVCGELLSELKAKGKLGFFQNLLNKERKVFRSACTVDGSVPETVEDFEAILALLETQSIRKKLLARWHRQMQGLSAPPLSEEAPEQTAKVFGERITTALDWQKFHWFPLEKLAKTVGISWANLKANHPVKAQKFGNLESRGKLLASLQKAVEHKIRAIDLAETQAKLLASEGALQGRNPIASRLLKAIRSRDPEGYRTAWEELQRLQAQIHKTVRRKQLITQLGTDARGWAEAVARRAEGHHGPEPPGPPRDAWLCAQWDQQLSAYQQSDLDSMQRRLSDLQAELRRTTAIYVEALTWKAQVETTGLKEQQALQGWMQLMRKIGKGTGKMAGTLKARARERLKECQSAVPVWVMPFSRVVESYRPGDVMFDVVIVDEASQADVTGLLAFTYGKELIVVGDHEQVSPSAIGEKTDKVLSLADQHLQGIPGRELFDGTSSVYDMAQRAFGDTIRLKEHFRCVPSIIAFSNRLCYDNEIKPLREADQVLRPPVISHHVPTGVRQGKAKTNDAEAREIASLIGACIEMPEYNDKTFGVISLLGDEQAYLIEKYLKENLDIKTLDERRITCGNSAQFQGDERDVMFLSMVDSPIGGGPLRLRGSRKSDRQRYNVASSRAKDQMWIVHSLNPSSDLKPDDIRSFLLSFATDKHESQQNDMDRATESVFEERVLIALQAEGYRVTPQLPIGSMRVDLVVQGKLKRVAIECDGDTFHPPEQLDADISRQALLERVAGLEFIRIRGSAYFREPQETMARVFKRLDELGIEKLSNENEKVSCDVKLREQVTARARAIRNDWWPQEATEQKPQNQWYPLLACIEDWPSLSASLFEVGEGLELLAVKHQSDEVVLHVPESNSENEIKQLAAERFWKLIPARLDSPEQTLHLILAEFALHEQEDSRELAPEPRLEEKFASQQEQVSPIEIEPEDTESIVLDKTQAIVSLLMDIVKADGVIMDEELDSVIEFFDERFCYDDETMEEIEACVKAYAAEQPPRHAVAACLREIEPTLRELILQAAIELSWVDGEFHENEKRAVKSLAVELNIPHAKLEALLEQNAPDNFDPYKALEVDEFASERELADALVRARATLEKTDFTLLGKEFAELARSKREKIEKASKILGLDTLSEPPSATKAIDKPVSGTASYCEYGSDQWPDVYTASKDVIADKITDIIAVEGPVQVKRVYDVYLKGLGLKRLGRELKRNLNKSLRVALDSGRVVQKNEDQKSGYIYLFVRAIDAPMIRVREAGPRSFEQIPLTELAAVMERLAPEFARGSEEHFRAVLHHYGFRRLTRGTEERLERALEWAHQIGAQF